MNFLKNLWEIISKFTFKDWIIVILSFLLLGMYISARHYQHAANNQTVIYKDSLYVYKNMLDSEYIAKNLYIQEIEDLKNQNEELYAEIKNLKDNPLVVTKIVTKYEIKEVPAKSDSIGQSKDSLNNVWKNLYWSANETNGYYSLTGRTDVLSNFSQFSTTIDNLSIPVDFTFDLIEGKKDKQIKIIARSNNPYVQIMDIDGAVVDPTKIETLRKCFPQKHWHIGPSIGYGLTSDMKLRPSLNISLMYSIFSF